ncbi:hypothetical protein Indivirus_1_34 [Indivirus ILV1]|uniref:Uncharacterized protein n=1 Tax=Indivirus ILV1 TaxID=1977633 RepID=A0A1V0SCJ0_9VIRU|nr:hypothetical protein Indivirus_1_34 [Indivirus ILV1]
MDFSRSKEISTFESSHGEMSLEPRLQEYLTKKKYYRDNNIEPSFPLEKEFQITSLDIQVIKEYLNGNTNVYEKVSNLYKKEGKQRKYKFASRSLMNDERVPKLKKMPNTDAPINRGMFAPEGSGRFYEDMTKTNNNDQLLNSRDLPKFFDGRGFDPNDNKFQPRIDPKIDPGIEIHSKYQSQYRIPQDPYKPEPYQQPRTTPPAFNERKLKPDLQDNSYLQYGTLKSSNDKQKYNYNQAHKYSAASDMDTKHKMVIPNIGSTSKSDLDYSGYRFVNFLNDDEDMMDPEMENELIRGMPSFRTHNRSYGYRNPQENYFDYIDPQFNDPTHTVESWTRGGDATRLENKTIAKNRVYQREIM